MHADVFCDSITETLPNGTVTISVRSSNTVRCGGSKGMQLVKYCEIVLAMAISITCSNCGERLRADDRYMGRQAACPKCQSSIRIPEVSTKQQVEVTKNLLGRYTLHYACLHCGDQLTSPLEDAGGQDVCPHCNRSFVVPGSKEKDKIHDRQRSVAEAKAAERGLSIKFEHPPHPKFDTKAVVIYVPKADWQKLSPK